MSFLDQIKAALTSKTAASLESDLTAAAPDIASTLGSIAINPSGAIAAVVLLVEKEVARLDAANSANADAIAALPAASATGTIDPVDLAESIFSALAPKLAPYAQIIGVLAQHFPALKDIQLPEISQALLSPSPSAATPAAQGAASNQAVA